MFRLLRSLLRKGSRTATGDAGALAARAEGALDAGDPQQATALLEEAVRMQPYSAELRYKLGVALQASGETGRARSSYERAVELDERHARAHNNIGCLLQAQGEPQAAIVNYRRALAAQPDLSEALSNLAIALLEQGEAHEAERAARAALLRDPRSALLHRLLGDLLRQTRRPEAAVESCREAVRLAPGEANAHNSLGLALSDLGRLDAAVEALRTAVALDPGLGEARVNLGLALEKCGDEDAALAQYRAALDCPPQTAEAMFNRAAVLERLYDSPDALACYRRVIDMKPDNAQAHCSYALQLFAAGDYVNGWRELEWRWRIPEVQATRPRITAPAWQGEDLGGKTILVHAEMGFGDTIQFARYVPLLARRGAKVLIQCQPALARVMRTVDGASAVLSANEPVPECDYCCPVMSLPLRLGTGNSIPAEVPYLHAGDAEKARFQDIARADERALSIGLVWSTISPTTQRAARKSLALNALAPLWAARGDARFVSLQMDPPASEIANLPAGFALLEVAGRLGDFADTAGCLAHLDLLITCDTAAAHLAGAMGMPVWTLVSFPPDWRWRREGERSPWYPSMRLFRQDRNRSWASAIGDAAAALRDFARPFPPA